jgi:hypothetical protein
MGSLPVPPPNQARHIVGSFRYGLIATVRTARFMLDIRQIAALNVTGAIRSHGGSWRKVRDSNPGEPFDSAGFPYAYSFRYRITRFGVWTLPSP